MEVIAEPLGAATRRRPFENRHAGSPANPEGFAITSMVIIFQIKHFIPENIVTTDANNG